MNKKEIYVDTISGEELIKELDTFIGNGTAYYKNNKNQYHRTDGPAVEYIYDHNITDRSWYQNGQLHNLNGPARIWYNGTKEWAIDGKNYTEIEFNIIARKEKLKNL